MDRLVNADAPYRVIAVVSPVSEDLAQSGKIRHIQCAPSVTHKIVKPYSDGGGIDYAVAPAYQRKGWILLRDLFEAEGNTEGWDLYKKHMEEIAAGRARKPFPEDKLPREVLRRRGKDTTAETRGRGARA